MKNRYNHIFLTVLLVLLGITVKANTCASAYSMNMVPCGPGYSALTSTFGEPTLAVNPCTLASGFEGVNWYTFTGTGDPVQASTLSQFTFFDTRIWVFEGNCGGLNCIGGNDNYGTGTSSQISFPTTLGTTYFIVVGGTGNAEGEYQLNVESGQATNGTTMAVSACDSYTTPSGNVYTTSGVYYDTIPNAAGCDSITTISLTIETIDNTVWYTGTVFLSNASGVDYQWIDCATGDPLPGETNANLLPPSSGSYAVIVSNGSCTDTSDCISEAVGLDENSTNNLLVITPNPNSGIFTIKSTLANGHLMIYGPIGRIIVEKVLIGNTTVIDITNQPNGVYILRIENEQELRTVRIIKK